MIHLNKLYNGTFFKSRQRTLAWRAPIVCGAIRNVLNPKTIIDIGCAVGDLVDGFSKLGIDSFGLEGAETAIEHFMCPKEKVFMHDLRIVILDYPKKFPKVFDVVICLEVAEHIEPEYTDIFLLNLQSLADRWIVMSAAPPGQGGDNHFNCQLPKYWIDKMRSWKFENRPGIERMIKREWRSYQMKTGIRAYYNNLLVFERINDGTS